MAKIKLTLPGLEIPVDGKQVSFTAPCSCSAVDGIHIDGVDYDLVDSAGNVVPFGRFVWCEGAVLTVTLDVTNRKAYLQNQNAYTRHETLTSATAELFGLGADAVPDDVFSWIGKYNTHWWKLTGAVTKYRLAETKANDYPAFVKDASKTIYYSSEIKVDEDTGEITLVNPASMNGKNFAATVGMYYQSKNGGIRWGINTTNETDAIIKLTQLTLWGSDNNGNVVYQKDYTNVYTSEAYVADGETAFATNADRNAYPDSGTVDDIQYEYLGIPFQNAVTAPKIATGSYTGTGTYGASNPNSLTFDFEPKAVFVYGSSVQIYSGDTLVAFVGAGISSGDNSNQTKWYTLGGKTLSWYSTTNATGQLNNSGTVYRYIAIG